MQSDTNKKIFYKLLSNLFIASVTNDFIWFALTFWAFLQTKSVLTTSLIAGTFAVSNMLGAFFFGGFVDKHKKKTAMVLSSFVSLIAYGAGAFVFFTTPSEVFTTVSSPQLWFLVIFLMIGSVAGNLRTIAMSTTVSYLFPEGRDKANGMIGAVNGISFSLTSVLSGLAIGLSGMSLALTLGLIATFIALIQIILIRFDEPEKDIEHKEEHSHFSITNAIKIISSVPGLFGLILFTTFNNFLGGVFMALMDAYGLSLIAVEKWGIMLSILSLGFIVGSTYIAKKGLGGRPLNLMLGINIVTWTTCIFFVIQPSIILLGLGMLIWMTMFPFIEATEQTVIQTIVPYEKQGRVFGFAQSVESMATPVTAFLIGPIAQYVFIPFMTDGKGVELIGSWFETGPSRGIALVFITAGIIGLIATLFARNSKTYKILSQSYSQAKESKSEIV